MFYIFCNEEIYLEFTGNLLKVHHLLLLIGQANNENLMVQAQRYNKKIQIPKTSDAHLIPSKTVQ